MNTIIIWLLITPILFAFGWFAGRIDMKTVIKHTKHLPKRIFDSIDALIDNKTGVASDNIRDIVEQEPQLTELQISLGKLYRHRGENDIAIKLHNKLLNSQYLFSTEDKNKVRLELAKDFQHAGLIDRAESLLLNLSDSELYANHAQELLLNIYQQDKNWKDAIEMAKKLATSDYSYHTEIAQFKCELAQEALIKSDTLNAQEYLNQALDINRKCVRANILLGEFYASHDQHELAIKTWQLVEKQNHLYLPMVINKIFDTYITINKIKEGLTLIRGYTTLYPELNLADFVYQKLLIHENPETTLEYLHQTMKHRPNAKVAARIIELHLNSINNPQNKQLIQQALPHDIKYDAEIIKALLLRYNEKLSRFRCGVCNFKATTFFWQCPACYAWESLNPNSTEN